MDKEVKKVTLEDIKHILAKRDVDMDAHCIYQIMREGCTGYDNMDIEDLVDYYICTESLRDVVLKVDDTFIIDIDEEGLYEF